MENKFIIGAIVTLILICGAVGCSYILNDPAQPSEQTSVAAGNTSSQNTTNVTQNQIANDTKKANATTKTVKQTCTKCSGKGYFICNICDGKGCKIVSCSDCGGDGDKPPVENMVSIMCHPCPACGGDGKLEVKCTVCGGDGKNPCNECNGKGYRMVTITQ